MPLWLDMLTTPMAAPETPRLRRMRLIWQALCLALAASVIFAGALSRAFGPASPCLIAALLAATIAWSALYWTRKHRADRAFLDRLGDAE
jgi:hypothetical protein